MALGSFLASLLVDHTPNVRNHLWMTLQSQSGVTLGLVAQMQLGLVGKQPWAKGTAAIITGCVVLNQLLGPTLCRFGIRNSGESQGEYLAEVTVADLHPDVLKRASPKSRTPKGRWSPKSAGFIASEVPSSTRSSLTPMHGLLIESEVSRTQRSLSMVAPNLEEEFGEDIRGEFTDCI